MLLFNRSRIVEENAVEVSHHYDVHLTPSHLMYNFKPFHFNMCEVFCETGGGTKKTHFVPLIIVPHYCKVQMLFAHLVWKEEMHVFILLAHVSNLILGREIK